MANQQNNSDERKRCPSESTYMNGSGDKYVVNDNGQITNFKYNAQDMTFSFAYGEDGSVAAIDSSTGWTWKRMKSSDFSGWVVRNYFDRWQVPEDECGAVYVEPTGIKAQGRNVSVMGLPEGN